MQISIPCIQDLSVILYMFLQYYIRFQGSANQKVFPYMDRSLKSSG